MNTKPGPASSVVERSLRKIFVRGDRGSIPAAGGLFSRDLIRNKGLTEIQYTWTGSSNLATSTHTKKLLRNQLPQGKKERSLNKLVL